MKVVYLTAGAAGMFCGSCMHDNALAKAMRGRGADCILQPVYTPIRTDEASVADQRVFLGGIHVYLLQQLPWLKFLPRKLREFVDFPPLIRWATRRAGATDPAVLGRLSVSMLKGADGNQAGEFAKLVDWVAEEIQPDAIILTNLLIGGGLPEFRTRLPKAKLIVTLQGDDIFLDHLPQESRSEAIRLCTELVQYVDHFCVHSDFYAQKMGALLDIPDEKLVRTPLSIDLAPYESDHSVDQAATTSSSDEFHLGYFARIAPEKGLHRLVEAFERIASEHVDVTLHVAGWLGKAYEPYLESIRDRISKAGLTDRFVFHGSPELEGKIQFMRQMDLLCVPTEYEDPKGLFVLESLAAGTPVVMPDHGAFGELVRSTGGGVLVPPNDVDRLCEAIVAAKSDTARREQLAKQGREGVRQRHSIEKAAEHLMNLIATASVDNPVS